MAYSSEQDDRSFHELLLWLFAENVRAGVGSVMCAYNRVIQAYSCENRSIFSGERCFLGGVFVVRWVWGFLLLGLAAVL